jgi:glycosyltransferase involved in cell wall biosynthesis
MTSSKQTPKVSIIMNCFNGEAYLAEAIESVINQTYKNWELILWDNCSTDDSAKIVQSINDDRIRYFQSVKHTSLGYARALAWEKTRGEFVAVLDVDDLWLSQKLENQVPLFEDAEVGMVISDTLWLQGNREKKLYRYGYPRAGNVFGDLLKNYFVSLQTLIMRKSFVDQLDIPSFDRQFSMIADFDLVMRLSKISKLALVKVPLAKWRIHANNLTFNSSNDSYLEKKEWIHKYQCKDFFKGYEVAFETFKKNIERSEIVRLITIGQKKKAFLKIRSFSFKGITAYMLIACVMMPFSSFFIRYLRYLKMRSVLLDNILNVFLKSPA